MDSERDINANFDQNRNWGCDKLEIMATWSRKRTYSEETDLDNLEHGAEEKMKVIDSIVTGKKTGITYF